MPSERPVPPVVRSRRELAGRGVSFPARPTPATALPIASDGTTYEMAQKLVWLDDDQFAVGRWDGSMSVFRFTESPSAGPLINRAVNTPAFQGVRMLAPLPGSVLASSNDDRSLTLWHSSNGAWTDLGPAGAFGYVPDLGPATSGVGVRAGSAHSLVVGHSSGHVTLWDYQPGRRSLTLSRTVDVRNPEPVNPWGLHDINATEVVTDATGTPYVVTGSEDGYVCVLRVPSGEIVSQTVFNPAAERGINSLSVHGDALLVANCSVGPEDHNLWYFTFDQRTWQPTLRDRANLIVDPQRPQAFNFSTAWGAYADGPCWFASTEEGALWMGTAGDNSLKVIGYQAVTAPLGSALGYRSGPGRLAMVAYDLYEFSTGAGLQP
jgi:hypothetical protein